MRFLILLLISFTIVFTACKSGNKDDASKDETSKSDDANADDPAYAIKKAMEGLGAEGTEPVDHHKLKDMLSENIQGYTRTAFESQKAGAFGFNISIAEADYEATGDKRIKASLADTGGAGMAVMSMAAWSSLDLDKEDQNGWERTSTYKGYKTFEKYDKSNKTSELAIMVEKRFLVTLNGTNCDMDELKKFVDELEIGQLRKMI